MRLALILLNLIWWTSGVLASAPKFLENEVIESKLLDKAALDFSTVQNKMQSLVESRDLSGASILLQRDGEILMDRHYGNFNSNTKIAIASASKWVSAFVLARLIEQKKLSFDDPLSRFFPNLPSAKQSITIRQLFSHTSGYASDSPCISQPKLTLAECVDSILLTPLAYVPGTGFVYGNTSMQIAARIGEIVSGQTWDQLSRSELFVPLGMLNTDYGLGNNDLAVVDVSNPRVAGGVRSSISDYARLMKTMSDGGVFEGRRLFSRALLNQMFTDSVNGARIIFSPNPDMRGYGFGLWIDLRDGNDQSVQVSSPGAFGFTPWYDRETRMFGIIAMSDSYSATRLEVNEIEADARAIVKAQGDSSIAAISVRNASGGGYFQIGSERHVFAVSESPQQAFVGWRGDVQLLDDPRNEHQILRASSSGIALEAVFRNLAPDTPLMRTQINNSNVVYRTPPNPKALVVRFHGSGGNAEGQFSDTESSYMNSLLIDSGYAIAALDSNDRINKQWDNRFSLDNPDVQNVQALITHLRRINVIGNSTPIYAIGISNGGGFSSRVSSLLSMRAQHLSISSGIQNVMRQSRVPTVWQINASDDVIGESGNLEAKSNFADLLARRVPAAFYELETSPVYPERFQRIPGISVNDSIALHQQIQSSGALDSNYFLTTNPESLNLHPTLPAGVNYSQISQQLELAYAAHEFGSENRQRILAFFDAQLETNITANFSGIWSNSNEPGWGVSIAAQGQTLVPVWYTYDNNGRPSWFLVSGARKQADGSYAGPISSFTGIELNQINGPAVLSSRERGTASFRLLIDGQLEFNYVLDGISQQKKLLKFNFSDPIFCRQAGGDFGFAGNRTDLWWQNSEPGWGVMLIEQGHQIFAAWYSYANDNAARWLTALLTRADDGSFSGAINAPNSGVPFNQINSAATNFPLPTIGNATLYFSDSNKARWQTTIDTQTRSKNIERLLFESSGYSDCQ